MPLGATYFLQLTLNGLMLGLLYALIAVGLALIFGVLEIINFAHGEFLMLGAFAMSFALPAVGLVYWPALAVAVAASAVAGLLLYQFFLARLQQSELERSILITMGSR
ncbi:MAG: ABC transporter permease subunit [Stellaceae bacterium]